MGAATTMVSHAIVIRVNDIGLQEAANCTKQWLSMAGPHLALPDLRQVFVNPFVAGELIVRNVTVDRFVPPNFRFVPNSNATLQMLTHSGYAEVAAHWELKSELLKVFRFPLTGTIRVQMTGLISEITMKSLQNRSPDRLEVSSCVARVRDVRANLQGSVAADVLQLFRGSITKVIRKKLEEVILAQSLDSVVLSQTHIDMRMHSDLIWDGEFVESEDVTPYNDETHTQSTRMVSIFIEEEIVQNILKASHYSGHLRTTLESPFLKTQCDVLCIGTVLPELSEALPNSTLGVEVATINAPVISLHDGQAAVYLNTSLEIKGIASPLKSKALVANSEFGILPKKTLDLIVDMSTPFVEDAVDMLLNRGIPLSSMMQFPTTNELLVIQEKSIRLEADINFPAVLQFSFVNTST
ncbi:unnamed protein product [Nippostrongylus brasiliensis]|uniref:BPI2 domain-containing protein n=1 Tax=Nippostrongylus brasiliensis TaxID=27835 RepID=A0A0N4XVK2_NIPBR|nr:unnamed protein product [Nippostrongylus brasiliensis]